MEEKYLDEDEKEIDLAKLFGIFLEQKKLVAKIVGGCTLIAMIISLIIPPTFHSNTLVQTTKANGMSLGGSAAALMAMAGVGGGSGATGAAANYIEMMKSRAVLEPVMDQLENIEPEEREEMTAEGFAKSNLEIESVKGTNLINVTGKGRTPEEAQMIADSVVTNFLKLMTEMNQSSQSFMVKFLNERIDTAKKESDEAAAKMEAYGREHKVYEPEEQSKALIEQAAVYDKMLGELQVKAQASQAEYAAANAQLAQQNANLAAYNVADSDVVVALREKIATKEVEIVTLEQKYQDRHPSLQQAREELKGLQDVLAQEVAIAVAAGTVSMNPTQAALIQKGAMAQVEAAVANASSSAVKAKMEEKDGDMAEMSEAALEYLKLKRDAEIKNQVYIKLVEQSEQARIQETMESMDIQVIDKANLPLKKSEPKRMQITLIGAVIGLIISFGIAFRLYIKEYGW